MTNWIQPAWDLYTPRGANQNSQYTGLPNASNSFAYGRPHGLFEKKIRELQQDQAEEPSLSIFTQERGVLHYYPVDRLLKTILDFTGKRLEIEKPPAEKSLSGLEAISTTQDQVAGAEIQTPPLPEQPDPSVAATTRVASVTNPLGSLQNLSQAQLSLLSPGEQAIAQRLNRRV